MNRVIVVGCFVPGYAIVRALGAKNLPVTAISYSPNDIAQLSRHVSEVVRIPHPEKDPACLIDCLMENRERWNGALILESADLLSVALSPYKEELSKYYRVATPDWPILSTFIDKQATYALADRCGVPHPKVFEVNASADVEPMADLQFPCIVKPVRSFEFVNRFHVKSFVVSNPAELKEKLQLCLDVGFPVLVQEIIPGPDENLYRMDGYVNSSGQTVGKFFNQKLRQSPPFFGVMRVGVSIERHPEMEQLTQRLLDAVRYRGYFSIEFKRDPRDGQLKLMENNCRTVRCAMLATASGVNHPWLIYQDLVENRQVDITEYELGTYWIEFYADLSNSLFHHRDEQISLKDYVKPHVARRRVFAELDPRDLRPFIRLTEEKLQGISGRLARGTRQ